MCDQHIRDDDNSYKELEFERNTKEAFAHTNVLIITMFRDIHGW